MEFADIAESDLRLDRQAAYLKIYGRAIAGAARRKPPRGETRLAILARQKSRCLYCDLPFGSKVKRKGKPVALQINWDHFVPYAYAARNAHDNWVAACHICNNIKSARMFDTVMQAQQYIRARWAEKGYEAFRGPLDFQQEPEPVPAEPAKSEAAIVPPGDPDLELQKVARRLYARVVKNRHPIARQALLASVKERRDALAALRLLIEGGYLHERDLGTHHVYSTRRSYRLPKEPKQP